MSTRKEIISAEQRGGLLTEVVDVVDGLAVPGELLGGIVLILGAIAFFDEMPKVAGAMAGVGVVSLIDLCRRLFNSSWVS